MRFNIDLTIFAKAKNKKKAENVFQKVKDILGLDFKLVKIERYWKDNGLFVINANCHTEGINPQVVFLNFIESMRPIAIRWVITVPDKEVDFAGAANSGDIRLPGIVAISINLTER